MKKDIEIYKTCSKCKIEKPLNNKYFHRDKYSTNGFSSACKDCINEINRYKWKCKTEKYKECIYSLEGEIWKDIEGYEGYYQVSNLGRVKSLYGNGKILSQSIEKNYYKVRLCKNGVTKCFSVHRLVAFAFIENTNKENFTMVNHKDENKLNNYVENLEWCDCKYNLNYGTSKEKISKSLSKKVYQYDLNKNFIKEWKSAREIKKELNYDNSHIAKCCNNKIDKAYGFIWSYIKF